MRSLLALLACVALLSCEACTGIAGPPGDDAGAGGGGTTGGGGGDDGGATGGGGGDDGGATGGGGGAMGGGGGATGGGGGDDGGAGGGGATGGGGGDDGGAGGGGATGGGGGDDGGAGGGGATGGGGGNDGGAGGGGGGAGQDAGTDDGGQWGLDARPANPTCVAPAPPPSTSGVMVQRAFANLTFSAPLGLFNAPGDPTRNYVMERGGRIRVFPNQETATSGQVTTALDLTSKVNTAGEGGLLGMAFHPQWPTRAELYVSYTETGVGSYPLRSVVARYTSTDGGATFDAASEQRLFVIDQPYNNHNGGNIVFGPDGFLYFGLGDGGSGGDPLNAGQRLNTNLGKLVRLDVNVPFAQRYAIPADNPYAADNTPCNLASTSFDGGAPTVRCAEIYALGLRNPWRFSFDVASSTDLWLADVGQNAWEEVNLVVRGGNYGWRFREGRHCYSPSTNCPTAGLIDPVAEYDRTLGNSITGGYVYRGTAIPSLVGKYVFGDLSGRVFVLEPNGTGGFTVATLATTGLGIGSFGQLADGEVYVLNLYGGQLYRLAPSGTPPVDTFPQLLSQTGCFDAADPKRPVPALIPYEMNAAFWSDGAGKQRYLAIPDGTTITVEADGDFTFPNGTVLVKTFSLGGKRIETRLLMRHASGNWAGYTYEWNDTETEATLLAGSKTKQVGTQAWYYPSRAQCMQCHTAVAGRALGPEVGQLNGDLTYPTGRRRNQVETLAGLGFFSAPLPGPVATLPRFEPPTGTGPLDLRARAWLHSNCSGCHRQGAGQGPADFRYALPLAQTNTCDVVPQNGDLGIANPRLIAPGSPARSIVSRRVHALDAARMPPLGSFVVDTQGGAVLDAWITSLTSCP
jgi:uncharacterized repeat protein (TIGR03806 family)